MNHEMTGAYSRRELRGKRSQVFGFAILAILIFAAAAQAAPLRFASPFVDHMVLQRGRPLEIWGTGNPGAKIAVHLADQQVQATADANGNWSVTFKPLAAGGPFDLTATAGESTATVHDLLIGEVWLCTGQSNMQFSLGECNDADAVAAVPHPNLRLGTVGMAWTSTPQASAKINWTDANPAAAKHFSAVAYTFASELEKDPTMKGVPIGILEDCLGGTVIESWLPKASLAEFTPKDLQSSMFGIGPTLLYNGMIAPLGHSSFAGVIWYQGEGNAGEPARYAKLLPILFKTWRAEFAEPKLPMLVVQLPDYAPDWGGVYWQWIRESQAKAVAATPNTALAVTIDTNDGWNLHPQGKHEIGRRLAMLARQDVYKENVIGHGPAFKSARADGNRMVVTFDTDGGGLTAGAGPVDGFMLAGKDGVYYTADAMIDGDSVIATCPDVSKPVTVRYAWAGVPYSTLTNSSRIPAAPFRTDDQPIEKGMGEAQRSATGYTFKGTDYRITIGNDGAITSLIARNQQLLSNAADQWGGARVMNRELSHQQLVNAHRLVCSNNETIFTIDFGDNKMTWTLENKQQKENAVFHIALSDGATVIGEQAGTQTVKRKIATVVFTHIDRVTTYNDIAADAGKVLEVTVAPGQTRRIEVNIGQR